MKEWDRLVLLGASNLRLGLSSLLREASLGSENRLEVLAAIGHGRSWGTPSRVLGRTLPSILESGVWRGLENAPTARTWALVTDVGNDLGYGQEAATVARWVEESLGRLEAVEARVLLVGLPVERLGRMSRLGFSFARRLLFPWSRLELGTLLDRATRLEVELRSSADRHRGVTFLPADSAWFGLDPIHIRRWTRTEVFRSWIERLFDQEQGALRVDRERALPGAWRLRFARPELWWWRGRERRSAQPSYVADRLRLSLH